MPSGYGIYANNTIYNEGSCKLMFKYDSFLYCKAVRKDINFDNYPFSIYKVNMITNELTLITGDTMWGHDLADNNNTNIQFYNGEIYFYGFRNDLYKINPNTNKLTFLNNRSRSYSPIGGKLVLNNGDNGSFFYDLSNGTIEAATLKDSANNLIVYYYLSTLYSANNTLYATGSSDGLQNNIAKKIYKIQPGQTSNFTEIYSVPIDGYITPMRWDPLQNQPTRFNNHLLYQLNSSVSDSVSILSLDLNDNSITTIFSGYNNNKIIDYYFLKDNIYFQNMNTTYQSNGSNYAIATDVPLLYRFTSTLFYWGSTCAEFDFQNTFEFKNKAFVSKTILDSIQNINNYEIWKTDGTISGTSIISNRFLTTGIDLNNSLFFIDETDYTHTTIVKYDDVSNNFSTIFKFPKNNGLGSMNRWLCGYNNSLFITSYNVFNSEAGLYKIDVSTSSSIVNDLNFNKLNFFPNPSNNYIVVQDKKNSNESFEYKIFDFSNRNIKTGFSKFNEQIDIECLTNGIYFIQLENNLGEVTIEKLIKK